MRNLLSSFLMICLYFLSLQRAEAQTQVNPYRYGSPYYWVTQSKLDSDVGKFDFAYDDEDDSIRQYVAYIYDKKSEYPLLKRCFEHR